MDVHVDGKMKKEKIAVGPRLRWGTWEELVLGSAVLRYGNKDWNVIASELRVRTVYPFSFTPEVTYFYYYYYYYKYFISLFICF